MAVRSLQERTTPGPSGGGEGEKTPPRGGCGGSRGRYSRRRGRRPSAELQGRAGAGGARAAPGAEAQRRLWPGGALGARGLRRAPIAEQECGHTEVGLRASVSPRANGVQVSVRDACVRHVRRVRVMCDVCVCCP